MQRSEGSLGEAGLPGDGTSVPPPSGSGEAAPGPPLTADEFEAMALAAADRLHGTALRLCRNRADADDLVQETMLRAWRAIATFRRGTRFEPWVFRILHNAFLNRRRRDKLAPAATDPDTLDPPARSETVPEIRSVDEVPALAEAHFDDRLKAAVEALPENFRVPFLLFALGGMSYEEIATQLSIPVGTVMSRLFRARAQLKARLPATGGAA